MAAFAAGTKVRKKAPHAHRRWIHLRRQAVAIVFGPAMLLCGDATQQVLLPKSRLRRRLRSIHRQRLQMAFRIVTTVLYVGELVAIKVEHEKANGR